MSFLHNIRVLDLTRRYPGAYCSMFLGDFGAEVIKVDPPPSPHAFHNDLSEQRYAAYHALDRNKRSVVLDLKKEGARLAFLKLVERADVLVEGFRPGVMDRLGVGYSTLSKLNPRLIYCSLTGFGPDGPYAAIPAHDLNYMSIAGALALTGERNGPPMPLGMAVADFGGAGMHGVVGILLALLARGSTRKGQFVDVSYVDSTISLLASTASSYFASGVVPKRGETVISGATPWAQVFRCQDGKYLSISPAEHHLWANLCRALGREDLVGEQNPPSREHGTQIVAELAAIFATRTRDDWYQFLKEKECCIAPVYSLDETFRDPQVIHRGMVVEVEHPTLGPVKQIGVPIKLSDTPGSIRTLGVPTGTDTEAVLGELGYAAEQIAVLRQEGSIG